MAKARKKRKRKAAEPFALEANPGIAIVGNPPDGAVKFGRPTYMEYVHVDDDDGVTRFHDFGRGAELWALEDGTVQLRDRDPRKRVWEDRPAD